MPHPKQKCVFYRNNKVRSKAFKNILFYLNIKCFGWVINVFLFCLMLFYFKVSFPAITAVTYKQPFWNKEHFENYFGKFLKKTKTKIASSRWLQFKSSWLYYDTNLKVKSYCNRAFSRNFTPTINKRMLKITMQLLLIIFWPILLIAKQILR